MMAVCRFVFDFAISEEKLVERIRAHVHRAGGSFEGSTSDGSFHLPTPVGEFKGYYQISGGTILLEVTDKPFFVPCSAIESKLRDYVEDA